MKASLAIAAACFLLAEPCLADEVPMYFETPSGNIFCTFNGSYLRSYNNYVDCEIYAFQPSYGAGYARMTSDPISDIIGEDCAPDRLSRYAIYDGGAVGMNFCPALDIVNIVDHPNIISDTFVLQYGSTFSSGGISCSSEKSGLTCVNGSGHGFFLSKRLQQVF